MAEDERTEQLLEDYEEEELMPGVFLMKPAQPSEEHGSGDGELVVGATAEVKPSAEAQVMRGDKAEAEWCGVTVKSPEELLVELARVSNACIRLLESQEAIAAAVKEDPDPVYEEALAENRLVIARQQAEIQDLREELFRQHRLTPGIDPRLEASPVLQDVGLFI